MSDVLQRVRGANPFADIDDLDPAEFELALTAIEDRWEFGDEPPRIATAGRSGWLQPALIAAGAALLVILAIAAPILFLRSEEQPVTDTSVPVVTTTPQVVTTTLSVATTTPTTVPPPVPTAPAMNWERVPHMPEFEDGWIKAVAVGDEGIVAAGGSGPRERGWPVDAAIWFSVDGLTWQAIDETSLIGSDPDAGGPWGATVSDLAAGPLGFVAGGHHGTSAAIWASSNGIEWTRTLDEPDSGVVGVSIGGPGWVAVGDVDMDGGIWVSEDGIDWTRIDDKDLLAGDRIDVTIYDVAAWNGGLIAVGNVGIPGGSLSDLTTRGAVWISDDGLEWTEISHPSFATAKQFEAVSVDPEVGTILAFGWGGIWRSADGIEWESTTWDGTFGGPPPASGIAWDGNRVVAGGPDMALSLWTSGDSGATWLRVDPGDPAFDGYSPGIDDATRFGDRFIAVGFAGEYLEEVGAIWIGTWAE